LDCLSDLSWIKQHRVVIVHSDVPSLPGSELSTYLDILVVAVLDWQPDEDHELTIAFPKRCFDSLINLSRAH